MAKLSKQAALKQLGGSAAAIARDLRGYGDAAKILSSNHPRMIDEHPSQWIAVYGGTVAATGRTLSQLLTRVDRKHIPREKTIIRFIDREERTLIL